MPCILNISELLNLTKSKSMQYNIVVLYKNRRLIEYYNIILYIVDYLI